MLATRVLKTVSKTVVRRSTTTATLPSVCAVQKRSFADVQAGSASKDQPMTQDQIQQLISGWEKQKKEKSLEKDNSVQPGLRLSNTAGRLAHSWFDLAATKGEAGIAGAEADLKNLVNLLQTQPDAEVVLQNKEFQRAKLRDFTQTQMRFSEPTVRFFESLVEARQMRNLNKVITSFSTLLQSYRKEIDAHLTVAKELSQKEIQTFTKEIREKYLQMKPEEKLNLIIKVDPSIRGGFELYSKGTYVDMSINRRLMALINSLREEEVTQFLNPDYAAAQKRENNNTYANAISANIRRLTQPRK